MRRSQAARDQARRVIDLALQLQLVDGPHAGWISEPYGGRWDRLLGEYAGIWEPGRGWYGEQPERIHTIRVSAQSLPYVMDWEHTMILAEGGRRSGKTTGSLAPKLVIALLCFAALPGEVLSPTYRQSMNVWRAVLKLTPRSWWTTLHRTDRVMELANASSVRLLSADRDDSARSEGVAWGAYDERQDISEDAAANAFLSTSDGGAAFTIFETATIKAEMREHHNRVADSPHGKIYTMDSYGNPFIDHTFLDRAKEFMDDALIDREIHAKWPDLTGRVYQHFSEDQHIRTYPLVGKQDKTAEVLLELFGFTPHVVGSPCRYWGIDPPHTAVGFAFYDDDTIHAVDEIVIGSDGVGGDCSDLARTIAARAPNSVVVIDPHDTRYDKDLRKYLWRERLRVVALKRMNLEYKLTAVRSRINKGKLLVDPACRFYAQTLLTHQYHKGRPDHVAAYSRQKTRHAPGVEIRLVHAGDAGAYAIYKIWPAKVDFEREEKAA